MHRTTQTRIRKSVLEVENTFTDVENTIDKLSANVSNSARAGYLKANWYHFL